MKEITAPRLALVGLALVASVALADEVTYAPESASREVRFANPPSSARILPLHHGRPNNLAAADAELAALKRAGFGGFAGNVNFTSNYLHDAASWKTLRYTVEKAHAMGMTLWLYDEKGYPSCMAGGLTLEGHPEWRARAFLVSVTNDANGKVRVLGVRDDYIHEGTHAAVSLSRYKQYYPNLLMREPTEKFIAVTHEAYRRELGPALKFFDSTFTDEPSLMTLWMRPMPELCLPVSDELLAAYEKRFGHSLKDDVPALVSGEAVGKTAEIRHRYWSMVAERVASNYTGRLTEWASANGLLSGGHLLWEEGLAQHVPLYGDFFRVLRGLSAPGCDILTSIPESVPPITPLLVGSAGELNGARRVMSEASDHSQRYRREGDKRPVVQVTSRQIVGSLNRQIWGGVNTFTSYYRWQFFTDAEKRAINEEIGRSITLVSEGHSAAEVALLYPADTLMSGYEPKRRFGGGDLVTRASSAFVGALSSLFNEGRPFMVVDAATLASARIEKNELVSGNLRWRTILLPAAATLPVEAARRLSAFHKAGGKILALGERPVNSESAFPDAEIKSLSASWPLVPMRYCGIVSEIVAVGHAPEIAVTHGPLGALRFSHRRTASAGDVFFVANDTAAPWAGAVRLAGDPATRIWNPRSGLFYELKGEIPLELPPYAAVILTTPSAVRGETRNAAWSGRLVSTPLAVPPVETVVSHGTFVKATKTSLADGYVRVESTLTKSGVDTFAFLSRRYEKAVFPPEAKGVSMKVRLPKANATSAKVGIFLETEDKALYYTVTDISLSKAGEAEALAYFGEFSRHGNSGPAVAKPLRPENIRSVRVGFGGYFGREGERIAFELSDPSALLAR